MKHKCRVARIQPFKRSWHRLSSLVAVACACVARVTRAVVDDGGGGGGGGAGAAGAAGAGAGAAAAAAAAAAVVPMVASDGSRLGNGCSSVVASIE